MKQRNHSWIVLIALCLVLSGCQKKQPDSEKAMENFLNKLEEGGYVMESKGFLKMSVVSRDEVVFEYAEDMYEDFVVMSVDGESFQAYLDKDKVDEVRYVCEGQAIDAARKKLPNHWTDEEVSQGNIWNLFYNIQEEPLKFVSHDDALKQSVLSFAGYGENVLRLMNEVYLVLDKEDPSSARIQAEMDEDAVARIFPEDIDIGITFKKAQGNEAAEAWMKDPVYPEARDGWNETDEFIFDSVFLPGYGLEAIPFPSFASYALSVDGENFVMDDEVCIRDGRATKQEMADYAAQLIREGFAEVREKDEDGNERTYYRKMLREDYGCYSSIELSYDDGVDLVAKKHYDHPIYDGLDAVNEVIKKTGYVALSPSDNFVSLKGTDRACEMSESWLYFFDYDLGLYVDIDFSDKEEMLNYLKEYEAALEEAGFTPRKDEEEDAVRYDSENGLANFRYNFMDDDTVSLLFKSERCISAKQTQQMIADAGFPGIGLSEPVTARDLRKFQKIRNGLDRKAYVTFSQQFESAEEAEAFLDAYEAALNEARFVRTNPENVGTLKQNAIWNEEKAMYVGIDYFPEEASVYFEFVAD